MRAGGGGAGGAGAEREVGEGVEDGHAGGDVREGEVSGCWVVGMR